MLCLKQAALFIVLVVPPPQAKPNPDVHYDKEAGFSLMKPPKNEEWKFDTEGLAGKDTKLFVKHRVDNIRLEVLMQPIPKGAGVSSNVPKSLSESIEKSLKEGKYYKDAKRVKSSVAYLPGKAAGGVRGWYLEMTMKDREGKPMELRSYYIMSKGNQGVYGFLVWSGEGLFA